jgi:hypothetical protein
MALAPGRRSMSDGIVTRSMTPADRLVIETLASAELDATNSAATWREIACAAFDKLAEQHLTITRHEARIHDLVAELRAVRAAGRDDV